MLAVGHFGDSIGSNHELDVCSDVLATFVHVLLIVTRQARDFLVVEGVSVHV